MAFKKPFRAVPVKPSRRYLDKRASHKPRPAPRFRHVTEAPARPTPRPRYRPGRSRKGSVPTILAGALILGAVGGIGSALLERGDLAKLGAMAADVGIGRARAPQAGDYWPGCNAVRAAGTAPIYASEPGYRSEMDGDNDGIACEPYHGS